MRNVLSSIFADYNFVLFVTTFAVCVAGSILTMRLFARARRSSSAKRTSWIFLAGATAGVVIWSTHFLAMLAYRPDLASAYDPVLTLLSLLIAITFACAGLLMASMTHRSAWIEAGGLTLGLGIAAMQYLGFTGFFVTGHIEWDPTLIAVSVLLAGVFGMLAMNRIARPVTRFCKYGGSLAFLLAILSLHVTAVAAMHVVPDLSVVLPKHAISGEVLAVAALCILGLVMGNALSTYVIDMSSQKENGERYRELSLQDALTGLRNRAGLGETLGALLNAHQDDTSKVAVVTFDLDRLKEINDVHGHHAGDEVLKQVGARITAMLGDGEISARQGGDEFVVVKPNVFTRRQVQAFTEKLLEEIRRPMTLDGQKVSVGASLGVSMYPAHGVSVESLLTAAELAMGRSKASSTAKINVYNPSMDEDERTRSALAMDLRDAIDNGELELHYQKQNDVETRAVIGFEVLLRWHHPRLGMVSPASFIPIAERNGLILDIGRWVLEAACREAAAWEKPYKIAVNLAPAQLMQTDLPKIVHEALMNSGLPALRLELEITEASIIEDQSRTLHVVRQLKALGVKIAMDDYGTGYSSLSTLQTFPFDKIKIDRAFVDGVTTSKQSAAIVKSTIVLADSLGISVLAEGAETEEHLAFLRAEGCREVQGFLFGRPRPIEDFAGVVGRGRAAEPPHYEDARTASLQTAYAAA